VGRAEPALSGLLVLMTWNPGDDDAYVYDRRTWVSEVVAPCLAGRPVASTWGVGRHRNGIGPGSPALLHRQGAHGRGVVARGSVTSEVMTGERTRTPGRTTNYVEVLWTEAVPIELRLDLVELEQVAPGFGWRTIYSSGRLLPEAVSAAVLDEWDALVRHPTTRTETAALAASYDGPAAGRGGTTR
jgi:hypothetical protein